MDTSRKDALKKALGNRYNMDNSSYLESIINQVNDIDIESISDDNFNSKGKDKPITEVISETIIYIWVLTYTVDIIDDLEIGEKIYIKLGDETLETTFSYNAHVGYIDEKDEETGDTIRTYNSEKDPKGLYLGINEKVINTPGSEKIKGMFLRSKYYQPSFYRTSDFKLVRENGKEYDISTIKF